MTLDERIYEQKASAEIEAWKRGGPSTFAKVTGFVFSRLSAPIGRLLEDERVQAVVQKAMNKALEAGTWTVPTDAIVERYVEAGYEVRELSDIPRGVPLRVADDLVRNAKWRHTGLAAGVGTAGGLGLVAAAGSGAAASPASGGSSIPAGLAAALGIMAADVVATAGLSCRMVSLSAAHYGFDTSRPEERNYAFQVLNTAFADSNKDKIEALTSVALLRNQLIRQKQPWSKLESSTLAKSLRTVAEKMGRSLTQAQLRRLVSIVGVATGGGFNGFQMHDVGTAAFQMYRERFLLAKERRNGDSRSAALIEHSPELLPADGESG
jgi:hypothetical protein